MTRHACPCCGYLTFAEAPGRTYEICPVCYWEDDPAAYADITMRGGANGVSLQEARESYLRCGAADPSLLSCVRGPLPEELPGERGDQIVSGEQ